MQVKLTEQRLEDFKTAIHAEWQYSLSKEEAYMWAMSLLSYGWELQNEDPQESLDVITF
jgi:hypothetical protein